MPKKRTLRNRIAVRTRAAARNTRRLRLGDPNFREWLNVIATLATVLIGVIGLWNTAQISGLQDYFQSEIAKRNRDLISLAQQSDQLSAESTARREQLSRLQISSSEIAALSISQESKIHESIDRLDSLKFDMLSAEIKLNNTKSEIAKISQERNDQAQRLELIYRRQSAPLLSYTGGDDFRDIFYFGEKPSPAITIHVGETYQRNLSLIRLPGENLLLSKYIYPARDRIPLVCPGIFSTTIDVAEIPPEIPPQKLKRSDIKTQTDADEFSREDAEHYKAEVDRIEKISQIRKKRLDDALKFSDTAMHCACKALADNGFTEEEICQRESRPVMRF